MGIERFIKTVCVQPAVYWAPSGHDGFAPTYATAVEIKVRWTDKTQIVVDSTGKEVVSKAEVLVTSDLQIGGLLWLGSLTGMPSGTRGMEIMSISKIPMVKSNKEFVRTVYLSLAIK